MTIVNLLQRPHTWPTNTIQMCPIISKTARRFEINVMGKCMALRQTSSESAAKTIYELSFMFNVHIFEI